MGCPVEIACQHLDNAKRQRLLIHQRDEYEDCSVCSVCSSSVIPSTLPKIAHKEEREERENPPPFSVEVPEACAINRPDF